MKRLFIILVLLTVPHLARASSFASDTLTSPTAAVSSTAPTVMIPWPKGCKLFCEGWMATYGTPPNDINHFVSNKKLNPPYDKQDWAANIDDARKVADARYKK